MPGRGIFPTQVEPLPFASVENTQELFSALAAMESGDLVSVKGDPTITLTLATGPITVPSGGRLDLGMATIEADATFPGSTGLIDQVVTWSSTWSIDNGVGGNISAGDTSIFTTTHADAGNVLDGDLLRIQDTAGNLATFMARAVGNGNAGTGEIVLDTPMPFIFLTASSVVSRVSASDAYSDIIITGGRLSGASTAPWAAVSTNGMIDSNFMGLFAEDVEGGGAFGGFVLQNSLNLCCECLRSIDCEYSFFRGLTQCIVEGSFRTSGAASTPRATSVRQCVASYFNFRSSGLEAAANIHEIREQSYRNTLDITDTHQTAAKSVIMLSGADKNHVRGTLESSFTSLLTNVFDVA